MRWEGGGVDRVPSGYLGGGGGGGGSQAGQGRVERAFTRYVASGLGHQAPSLIIIGFYRNKSVPSHA